MVCRANDAYCLHASKVARDIWGNLCQLQRVYPIEGDEEHVRLRRGIVRSSRPLVVAPQYYRSQMLENFGEDAKSYLDEVLSRQDSLRIIQYGLRFMKEEHSEWRSWVAKRTRSPINWLRAQDDNQQVQGVLAHQISSGKYRC